MSYVVQRRRLSGRKDGDSNPVDLLSFATTAGNEFILYYINFSCFCYISVLIFLILRVVWGYGFFVDLPEIEGGNLYFLVVEKFWLLHYGIVPKFWVFSQISHLWHIGFSFKSEYPPPFVSAYCDYLLRVIVWSSMCISQSMEVLIWRKKKED